MATHNRVLTWLKRPAGLATMVATLVMLVGALWLMSSGTIPGADYPVLESPADGAFVMPFVPTSTGTLYVRLSAGTPDAEVISRFAR